MRPWLTLTSNMTSELPFPPPKWAGDVSVALCSVFSLMVGRCRVIL